MPKGTSKQKRGKYSIPEYISHALEETLLMKDYRERPAYQQNDYIGWIIRAKKQETKEKRLQQMLNELKAGGVYMKMEHAASARDQ